MSARNDDAFYIVFLSIQNVPRCWKAPNYLLAVVVVGRVISSIRDPMMMMVAMVPSPLLIGRLQASLLVAPLVLDVAGRKESEKDEISDRISPHSRK